LDAATKTVTLKRPLLLDLGAVAKGLAIDLAARELADFKHFVIDAGGDLYVAGHKAGGQPWSVGIRHPRRNREVIELVRVSDAAVCTSGDYERQGSGDGHHILDPRNDRAADVVASATVVAPTAMLADALATAAFVLGPVEGIRLLERHGVDGVLLSPAAGRFSTRGMRSAILPDA
jgi:thiamine biosynthesis lipoprotein